jgi:hypothetical protein
VTQLHWSNWNNARIDPCDHLVLHAMAGAGESRVSRRWNAAALSEPLRQIRQPKRIALHRLIPLAEPQDGREGFVDSPLLVWTDPAHQIAQPSGVDRADLLN